MFSHKNDRMGHSVTGTNHYFFYIEYILFCRCSTYMLPKADYKSVRPLVIPLLNSVVSEWMYSESLYLHNKQKWLFFLLGYHNLVSEESVRWLFNDFQVQQKAINSWLMTFCCFALVSFLMWGTKGPQVLPEAGNKTQPFWGVAKISQSATQSTIWQAFPVAKGKYHLLHTSLKPWKAFLDSCPSFLIY